MHELRLPKDKHGRDGTLASYIQYVFSTPQGPGISGFDTRHTANQRSSRLFSDDEVYPRRSASLRQKQNITQRKKLINVVYRITGNVCVAKFLSFKFLRDLIFEQTEHAQYKMHVL